MKRGDRVSEREKRKERKKYGSWCREESGRKYKLHRERAGGRRKDKMR